MRANGRGFLLGLVVGVGGTLAAMAIVDGPQRAGVSPGGARGPDAAARVGRGSAETVQGAPTPAPASAPGRRSSGARARGDGDADSGRRGEAARADAASIDAHLGEGVRLWVEREVRLADWLADETPRAPSPFHDGAARADAAGRSADNEDPAHLLASVDGAEALVGVVLAARAGRIDLLVEAARVAGDAADGPVQRAAVEALVLHAATDSRTPDAVRAAWRSGSTTMRETIAAALAGSSDTATAVLAREFLRERTPRAVQRTLAGAALRDADAATLLREAADAPSALSLAIALRHGPGWAEPYFTEDGQRRADAICDALLPWLRGPGDEGMKSEAATFFSEAQRWSRFGALLADRGVPASVRVPAMKHALSFAEPVAECQGGIAALLEDPDAGAAAIIDALSSIGDLPRTTPPIRSAVERLATSAADAWVREAARMALQRAETGDVRSLQIVRATYGADGADGADGVHIDVTSEIRAACAGGRLRIAASNQIAGDPVPGSRKTLRVEFITGGRRFTAAAEEGDWLAIP